MQNNKNSHICKWNKITKRHSGHGLWIHGLESILDIFYNFPLSIRIRKNRLQEANIFKCEICKEYKWKCPYCETETIMREVPRMYKCESCGNKSYFDPYKEPVLYPLQKSKKP